MTRQSRPSVNMRPNNVLRAFKFGARPRDFDVARLLAQRGHSPTGNRLREMLRDSDRGSRGSQISIDELYDVISAWADEQRQVIGK